MTTVIGDTMATAMVAAMTDAAAALRGIVVNETCTEVIEAIALEGRCHSGRDYSMRGLCAVGLVTAM